MMIIVFLGVGTGYAFWKPEKVSWQTTLVASSAFTQTVEVSGELESVDEVELSFDVSGTLEEVVIHVGDEVKAGDLLAYLESEELLADAQNAYQAVQVAQANLVQKQAGSTQEAIAVAQAQATSAQAAQTAAHVALENAQQDLTTVQTKASSAIASAQASLQTAQDAYEDALVSLEKDVDHVYEDLVNTLWSSMIEVRNAISDADEVLGVQNATGNDDYELALGVLDLQTVGEAETAFFAAQESRDAVESLVFALTFDSDHSVIDAVVSKGEEALSDAGLLLWYTRQVLEATVPTAAFSASELSALKDTMDASRNAIQTDQSSLLTALQASEDALTTQEVDARALLNAKIEAQRNLEQVQVVQESAIFTAQAAVRSAEATLAIRTADAATAQATLGQTQALPRSIDVAAFDSEVERAQAAYDAAQARLAKAEIRSPIDGKVSEIVYESGEQVVAASRMITVQTVGNQYRIKALVTESDIAKISLNDQAEVTFDALSDEVSAHATVTEIDPAETLIEGVVYYEVTLYMNGDAASLPLKPGMSADLDIRTAEETSAIAIPQRAVLTKTDRQKYVRVVTGKGTYEEREVVTGVLGDKGMVLILSGLSEGEEIILKFNSL
jgi:multidrug efflux pump subunit AcrA (membrane-fusion protein)